MTTMITMFSGKRHHVNESLKQIGDLAHEAEMHGNPLIALTPVVRNAMVDHVATIVRHDRMESFEGSGE